MKNDRNLTCAAETDSPGGETRVFKEGRMGRGRFTRTITLALLIGLFLPVGGSLASMALVPQWRWDHVPFHAVLETAGGFIALALAGILLALQKHQSNSQHHLWMSAALVGMGIFDLAHAAVAPGQTSVWFHSTATFVGGVLFALVWLPARAADSSRIRLLLPCTALATLAVCVFSLLFPRALPSMIDQGAFSPAARALNTLGGIGFLAAACWFLLRYRVSGKRDDYLFVCLCFLFGAAGALFELSFLWDAAWWWWHSLRLAAYGLGLSYSALAYLRTNERLYCEIAERKRAEGARERLLHDLGERVKELHCVYGVAKSVRERETLDEVFQDAASLIPLGWRYPEITRGKVRLQGREFVSQPFEETEWKQTSDIVFGGERRGTVEVYYLEQRPHLDEGPFLKEERNLIDGIAHALSEAIERKQAEETLQENKERLQGILDTIRAGVVLVDAESHVIIEANPAVLEMIGAPREQVIGRVCHECICPAEEGRCPITDLGEKFDNSEHVLLKADGQAVPVLKTVAPMMLGGRKHLLDCFIDITDRKRAEEELREANTAMVEALKREKHAAMERESAMEQLEAVTQEAKAANASLAEKLQEVESFNRLAVGRELRMIQLKEEINHLLAEQGKPAKYEIAELEATA